MMFTFLVSLAAMALLWVTLVRYELASKAARAKLSRLRRALDGAGPGAATSRIAPAVPSQAGSA
jgi:hypothetical protein